jgi:hypothetical protein
LIAGDVAHGTARGPQEATIEVRVQAAAALAALTVAPRAWVRGVEQLPALVDRAFAPYVTVSKQAPEPN